MQTPREKIFTPDTFGDPNSECLIGLCDILRKENNPGLSKKVYNLFRVWNERLRDNPNPTLYVKLLMWKDWKQNILSKPFPLKIKTRVCNYCHTIWITKYNMRNN